MSISKEISEKEKSEHENSKQEMQEKDKKTKSTTEENSSQSNSKSSDDGVFFLDIAVLNEISKACQMAMYNISILAKKISDKKMKKELVAIYSQYSNILLQINQHFEKYGEIPEGTSSNSRFVAQCAILANLRFNSTNSHVAEIMIQGLQMGTIKCYKLLNNGYDIEDSTTKLLQTFLDFQKENIKKLNAYL